MADRAGEASLSCSETAVEGRRDRLDPVAKGSERGLQLDRVLDEVGVPRSPSTARWAARRRRTVSASVPQAKSATSAPPAPTRAATPCAEESEFTTSTVPGGPVGDAERRASVAEVRPVGGAGAGHQLLKLAR